MVIGVNASVRGSHEGPFLYTIKDPQRGEFLDGIEWAGAEEAPQSPQ